MNPTINELISLNQTVTKALKQPAWIAGGALRDVWHNKPVKDIDIFTAEYPTNLGKLYEAITGFKNYSNWGVYAQPEKGEYKPAIWHWDKEAGYVSGDFLVLNGGVCWHGFPVQLVVAWIDTPEEVVKSFDIDLCKLYIQGERLITTPAFRRDSFNHQITVNKKRLRSEDHLKRIAAKYPSWRIQIVKTAKFFEIASQHPTERWK